ncbi:MAG: hypothetical protein ABJM36_00375 [Algibacter sp.]|uniref:hypothetical protein n=1 Tax=Algibacter sp. TaxID=1872428 RepID=UPI003298217E
METKKNIQDKVDSTFNALDAMEPVNVSPFFKDKTMQVLFAEKDEKQSVWNWFTPKLQLAALVCIVVLNVVAFSKMETASSYDENLSEFAESYGLVASDNDSSILN